MLDIPRSSEQNVELEAEKRANDELRVQVADLSKKVQEYEEATIRDEEEMKKNQSDMEAKLELVLNQFQPS